MIMLNLSSPLASRLSSLSMPTPFTPWVAPPVVSSPLASKRHCFCPSLCNQFYRVSPHCIGRTRALVASIEADALAPITIYTVHDQPLQFRELWDQNEGTAVVAFLRHFGCPLCWDFAASLRDAKPKFDDAGVKLIAIGVGTPDKAQILAERMPFPKDCLYADPDRKAYNALNLYYGVGRTFLNPSSAQVLGRLDSIQKALKGYTLSATPDDRRSVLQQGGLYIFKGKKLLYARKDEGTGDHAPLDEILKVCSSAVVA